MALEGVLVLDKPSGMTSHDVVATARRALGETRIGHTGTLDPLATGVLPLAVGRATRLAQFLSSSDKEYVARIQLGVTTDTYDVTGRQIAWESAPVSRGTVRAALDSLTGDYLQSPPPYSAKKIANRRAYDLAREGSPVQPDPVRVSVRRLDLIDYQGDIATVSLTCSAGFYVRSLAHDLGQRIGVGACLQALRRTRSGEFGLENSVTMVMLAGSPKEAVLNLIPVERLLPRFPAVTMTPEGEKRVSHGREVAPAHFAGPPPSTSEWVRLMSPAGTLLALARPGGIAGSLHPSVVLI